MRIGIWASLLIRNTSFLRSPALIRSSLVMKLAIVRFVFAEVWSALDISGKWFSCSTKKLLGSNLQGHADPIQAAQCIASIWESKFLEVLCGPRRDRALSSLYVESCTPLSVDVPQNLALG